MSRGERLGEGLGHRAGGERETTSATGPVTLCNEKGRAKEDGEPRRGQGHYKGLGSRTGARPSCLLTLERLPDQSLHGGAVEVPPGGLTDALALLAQVRAQVLDLVA
jgi:hypothetical protein